VFETTFDHVKQVGLFPFYEQIELFPDNCLILHPTNQHLKKFGENSMVIKSL